jgi:hypothetical protein
LIDIFAGITLAVSTTALCSRVAAWEAGRRERIGALPVWKPLFERAASSSSSATTRSS